MSKMKNTVYRLGELCEVKSGKRIPKNMDYVTYETEHPYIRARDIKDGKINTDSLIYLEDVVFQKIKKYIINSGDIAITIVGASVGDTGYASNKIDGYNLTENAIRLTNYAGNVEPKFLHYILSQKQYHDYMQLIAGAAAQPKLGIYKVKRIKVGLPKIENQRRIADILSAYDNLIENNNKQINLLEQMAENLYREWFVRFRFPGYEDTEFEEKKPRGWQVGTDNKKNYVPTIFKYDEFRNIGSFIRGKNITAANMIEGEIPVISAGIQPSGYHNEANIIGASLTISASGANAGYLQYHLNDIWAADCSYYQDEETIWFAYNTLKYLQPVISNLQCGAAQPHVYPKNINRIYVLIPTMDLIKKYNEFVSPYYEEICLLNKSNISLIKQRDYLLPRLMSGKLEV